MDHIIENRIRLDLKVYAYLLLGLSLGFLPPIYLKLFSVLPLLPGDKTLLLVFFGVTAAFSIGVLVVRDKIKNVRRVRNILVLSLFFLGLEFSFRVLVNRFFPTWRKQIATHEMVALPNYWRYQGHPFLQFVGNPNYLFDNNWVNQNGFYYKETPYEKKPGEIRIACMGGSTTRDFPNAMHFSNPNVTVMNFSLDAYTPAHSLINFELNAIPYHPDYVVFHHTPTPTFNRNDGKLVEDYRDSLKSFTINPPADVFLIRTSILYTELRNLFLPLGDWYHFRTAVILMPKDFDFSKVTEEQLSPFQRDLKSFVDISKGRGIRLVLTTHPHKDKEDTQYVAMGNEMIRNLHQENPNSTILVDLDKQLSGKYKRYFEDEVHFNAEGNALKAKLISEAIEEDLKINKNLAQN